MGDANVTDFPNSSDPIRAMKGPQQSGYQVIVEGRAIPKLTMIDDGPVISLILDGRFCVPVPRDLAPQVAWLVANALAIGEGYPFLGSASKERPFAPEVRGIVLGGEHD